MKARPIPFVAVLAFSLCAISCRTDQNEAEDRTRAAMSVFKTCFDYIGATSVANFRPVNFEEFLKCLFEHEYLPRESHLVQKDGWRNPYELFASARRDGCVYLINSAGPDETRGTQDDVTLFFEIPARGRRPTSRKSSGDGGESE